MSDYPKVEITEVFKPKNNNIQKLFCKAVGVEDWGNHTLNINEIRGLLSKYIDENDLQHKEQRNYIIMDPLLAGAIPKNLTFKDDATTCVRKDQLFKYVPDMLSPHY